MSPTLMPGTRLGHYTIGPLLGAGGMGQVYRATDTRLGRDVALKVLRGLLAGSARADPDPRPWRPRSIIPHIVTLYSVEDVDGVPGAYEHAAFDGLGYTCQPKPRRAMHRQGKAFVGVLPAINAKAAQRIRATLGARRRRPTSQRLEQVARVINPVVRGWVNYDARYYPSRAWL